MQHTDNSTATANTTAKRQPKRGKRLAALMFLLLLIIGTVWILRFRGTATLRTAEGPVFGTYYHIKYEASQALDSVILAELKRIDSSLSVFNQLSTISAINAGTSSRADAMLYEVLTKAQKVSEATDGAFDVTVMPLVNAWGFGFKKGIFPTDSQVDSLRAIVGFRKISLSTDSIISKSDPRIMIDCGAIAKGYSVDRVARVLREHGVRNYMIEIGGEVITKGRNPKGMPWQIGVNRPVDKKNPESGTLQTVLSLENSALATSGNYNNYYERNGRKYAHTIDPRTGRPVQHSLLSATVIAPDCATADAYATAFMVLGLDETKKILQNRKELKAFLIFTDGKGELQTESIRMPH